MDLLLLNDMESGGGRYLAKAAEPVVATEQSTHQEMRLMHLDFVEESYWKRCAAVKLAAACKDRVLKIRKDKLENPKCSYEIDGMYNILRYTQVDMTDYP
jgi:hypothetical protein